MSDTSLPVIFRFDTTANRMAFTPTPGVAEQLYLWADSDDQPNAYYWDGAAWQLFNAGGAGGITELTGDVTAGPGSGSQAATIPAATVTDAMLANMNALTIKLRAANSAGVPSNLAISDGETAKRVGTAMVSAPFGPASVTLLTNGSGATYTVPANIYRLRVTAIGGGAGGGGADSFGVGGGGGSGGYAIKIYNTTPGTNFTYTVSNVGGAGGTAGQTVGTSGADSTFDNGGSTITGGGGVGGNSQAGGSGFASVLGGTGGTASGGNQNFVGGSAQRGWRFSGTLFMTSVGCNSPWGGGGDCGGAAGSAGSNATGFGAGGGGATAAGGTDRAGGNGSPGLIIVEEFN